MKEIVCSLVAFAGKALVVYLLIYFTPSFVARLRGHNNSTPIGIINLFLGWTFFGWVVALAWALTKDVKPLFVPESSTSVWPELGKRALSVLPDVFILIALGYWAIPALMSFGSCPTSLQSTDGITMRWIPAGEFQMGCTRSETVGCSDNEPSRHVRIERGFWMHETEVTQQAYKRVTGRNPSFQKGSLLPVHQVTWKEAKNYCEQVGLRLPTEEEWEYAARAGTTGSIYGDVGGMVEHSPAWRWHLMSFAWFGDNSERGSELIFHEVKGRTPNEYGLYDMLGNVWEWTDSGYDARSKTARGGSSHSLSYLVRLSSREGNDPNVRKKTVGFRCVRD